MQLTAGLCLIVALAGCGGGGGNDSAASGDGQTVAIGAGTVKTTIEPKNVPPGRQCGSDLHDLLHSLDGLRAHLVVGETYGEYLSEVRRLTGRYAKISADQLAPGCLLTVATPAEQALNEYIDALNEWGQCLETAGCGSVDVAPKLKKIWAVAAGHLSDAHRGLRNMQA